jgi:chromosome segregation ATPase
MAEDPNPPFDVKFDPNSRELLNTEMKAAEQTLDDIARRPFEMLADAEATVSRFPPLPAILSIVLGGFLALCAIPYAVSWNGNLWKGWNETVEKAKTSQEIRSMPTGRNWMPTVVIAPLAVVAVGLGVHSRRHRLGVIGLCVGCFALAETLGGAAIYEWRDGAKRETFALAQDVKMAQEVERQRQLQAEEHARQEEARKKAEEAKRLADAELERKKQEEQEAARERARAELDAALRAQQERQRQEAEKREQEKQRLEEEAEKKRQAELDQQLSELDKARVASERTVTQLQQRMDSLVALRDKQANSITDLEQSIAEFNETIEKNEKLAKPLKEQQDELNAAIGAADRAMERARDQRNDLRKLGNAASTKDAVARLAETESLARDRKTTAVKGLRDLENQLKDLQRQSGAAASGIKRTQAALDKLNASTANLEDQIAGLEVEQEEAEQAAATLKVKAEKLKVESEQDKVAQ